MYFPRMSMSCWVSSLPHAAFCCSPVEAQDALADPVLDVVDEEVGLADSAGTVDVVIYAEKIATSAGLLDLTRAVRGDVGLALRGLGDDEVIGNGVEVDAVLPVADVDTVHGHF